MGRRSAQSTHDTLLRVARSGGRRALEDDLARQLRFLGAPDPIREMLYSAMIGGTRRWRADMAWPDLRLIVEVEGGTWSMGRHIRGAGYAADCEKHNAAQIAGLTVLRYTSDHVRSGYAAIEIAEEIARRMNDIRRQNEATD